MTDSNLGDVDPTRIAEEIIAQFGRTAFDDLRVVQPTPIAQSLGTNGLTEKLIQRKSGTGDVAASSGLFQVSTGATSLSFGSLATQTVPYKARMGCLGVLTAAFTTPVASSQQIAGFITATDRLAFGYNGTTFGIWRDHHGQNGIWNINITTGATGSGTASVTLNGTLYSIPVTAGTIQHTAYEIATYLAANATNYRVYATDDDVTILYDVAQPAVGAYSFSSTGGVVGSMTNVIAGSRATPEHIPQSTWDDPAPWIVQTNLTVYAIQYQYLGAGKAEFFVEHPNGNMVKVHTIKYSGTSTIPLISDPNMRVGITAASLGSTTNLVIKSCCMAAFVDGYNLFTHDPHVIQGSLASAGTTGTNMVTIRNKVTKGTRDNRIKVRITSASGMTQGTKGALIQFIKNGTYGGEMIFYDYDSTHSVIQYATDAVTVTGTVVNEIMLGASSNSLWKDHVDVMMEPGDVISLVGSVIATPTAYMLVSAHIQEDM